MSATPPPVGHRQTTRQRRRRNDMSKFATISQADHFLIQGIRALANAGHIDEDTRKKVKQAVFNKAKAENGIGGVGEDIKVKYESNSNDPDYLVLCDKSTGVPIVKSEPKPASGSQEELEE